MQRLALTIGGEAEWESEGLFSYLTDSGRSSLRLLLRSGFRDKRFLVPDYFCKVIVEVLDEYDVDYSFYKVREDLSVDITDITGRDFDVFYLINYFGQRQDVEWIQDEGKWIVEDCVFLPVVEPPPGAANWIGFNSFRKISSLADGSILKSTFKLSCDCILDEEAAFASLKYKAKQIKYDYLHKNSYSEEEYLTLFREAENLADKQRDIYSISRRSLLNLLDFYLRLEWEYAIRQKNYRALDDSLKPYSLSLRTDYPALYVLHVNQRDKLREYLFTQKIFLPTHWPNAFGIKNELYNRVISTPVDSRYGQADMQRVAEQVLTFFNIG